MEEAGSPYSRISEQERGPCDEHERRIMDSYIYFNLMPEDIDSDQFLDTGREQETDKKRICIITKPLFARAYY